jgi:hypothetical protein
MSTHRYSTGALAADYGRAGVGLALTLTPLLLVQPAPPVALSLGALAVLSAAFALRTVAHQLTEIALDSDGINVNGAWPRAIPWRDLSEVSLAYYATRRDNTKGWMQLRVRAANRTIKVDSTIADFAGLVGACLAAANAKGLRLSARTLANSAELGVIDHRRVAA